MPISLASQVAGLREEAIHYAKMAKETTDASHRAVYLGNEAFALKTIRSIHTTLVMSAEAHCRQLLEQLGGAGHSITDEDYPEPLLLKKFKMAVHVLLLNCRQYDKLYKTRMLKTYDNPLTEMRHHLGRFLIQAKRAGWAM